MSENEKKEHPFDRLMFGNRSVSSEERPTSKKQKSSSSEEFDLVGMLSNIDNIMGSINKVKPIMKQLSPILELFKTKK